MAKLKSIKDFCGKKRSEIGIIAGIITGAGALASAIYGTIKAYKAVNAKKQEEDLEKLSVKETIKLVWMYYIVPVSLETASILFIIDSHKTSKNSILALSTACLNADSMLKTYKEKVIETVGENKERQIHDAVLEEKVKSNPVSANEVVVTNKGNTLMFDIISGRYFESDIETIRKKVNDINLRLRDECEISLNEFYDEIGLPHIKIGDGMGWNIDQGYLDIYFGAQLTEDGRPCIVLDYTVAPDYDRFNR